MKNIWESFNFGDSTNVELPDNREIKTAQSLIERYNQCKEWVNRHDNSKIKVVTENVSYNDNFSHFQKTIHWFNEMSELTDECKKILFGDIFLSIDDIKEKMLKHLKADEDDFKETSRNSADDDDEDYEEEYYGGDYDDCGHASPQGYRNVVNFFESLDEDSLMSIAAGSTQDDYEVDLDGGRSYLMSGSNIYLYIFNYLFYTKKLSSQEEYEDMICNSGDASDTIEEFYLENFYLPSDDEFEKMYQRKYTEKYQKTFERYNYMIDNVLKEFSNEPMLKDLVSEIKKLKADDAYIQAKVREVQIDKIIK
jgi:hypothetical protein